MTKLYMGNEAMGRGAIDAGVQVVSGYPGTPSTEVLEYIASNNENKEIYVEWSVNEKVAVEVAGGAAMGGKRALVTMKQVGLNAAADPVMNLSYIGTKAGLVILVADDPGPISSQTEQDTREFGVYSKIPVLDPSNPEEAYMMMVYAFGLSERFETPVIIRPTTRICHSVSNFTADLKLAYDEEKSTYFEKDSKWVIFPALSYKKHEYIDGKRNPEISKEFSKSKFNKIEKFGNKGIVANGISHSYTREAIDDLGLENQISYLKLGIPYPFPEDLILNFLEDLDQILIIEELSPYMEREITRLIGKHNLNIEVFGKESGHTPLAGENSVSIVKEAISDFLGLDYEKDDLDLPEEYISVRPPTLCPGCPHRASFYTVKEATSKMRAVYTGDIGCYTLGNALPLDMVDTCLCMGAGFSMAQGLSRSEKDLKTFAFIGDSTFFHSGMTGVVNAVYNKTDTCFVVLDNRTTAMTGNQPSPATGQTMMGEQYPNIDIEQVLRGLGLEDITKLRAFNVEKNIDRVREIAERPGPRAIIFEDPCIKVSKSQGNYKVMAESCIHCRTCVEELGCPAFREHKYMISIDPDLCDGCGICEHICPTMSIVEDR